MTHAELFTATGRRQLDGSFSAQFTTERSCGKGGEYFCHVNRSEFRNGFRRRVVFETLCYIALTNQKAERSAYMKKRLSHEELALTKEFDDEKLSKYFRLNHDQFKEVHDLMKN